MDGSSVFLTGAPGAGKTYVLNEFIRRARLAGKNVAITASTGIAATHIGGSTIHSWSGMGIQDYLSEHDLERLGTKKQLLQRYNAADILVIDEVSMLHGRRLDSVNVLAKRLRQSEKPFGGLQVVLVGDLFQLPPIDRDRRAVPDFAHLSDAWAELDPTICYLSEQHRVAQGDALLDLLVAMRDGSIDQFHEAALSERLGKKPGSNKVVTRLYSHNVDVDRINQTHLDAIVDDEHVYQMQSSGSVVKQEQLQKSVLAPQRLVLKRGAEVMFVANNFPKGFVNGTRGTVSDFDGTTPIVVTARGREIRVESHSWSLEEDGRVQAEVSQLPIRLAWAITIHKSQGMSLDAAEIDLSRSFTPGMGYVALSRVRSMDGLYLVGANSAALQLHPLIFAVDHDMRAASHEMGLKTADFTEDASENEVKQALDEALLIRLKEWRKSVATKAHIPLYMVLHDTTLKELATRRPKSKRALMAIKGMGPMKLEKYGTELLNILDE